MRTAGIVCEYNPFHPGHGYQICALRDRLGPDTAVVALMSGNYVQRGEPAIYDKWTRARLAVLGGADLVLELPLTVAVNAGGYFAGGAVDCLRALGGVEYLCFGSEGHSTEELLAAAELLGTPEYDGALRARLERGVSYARSRQEALEILGGNGAVLRSPNSALGVDYLRRLRETGSPMEPLAIPRMGRCSASALREKIVSSGGGWRPVHTLQNGERAMLAVLRSLPEERFRTMPFGSEGLWSKFMKACRREDSLEGILFACKSKRYALSRLRRMALCLYLGLSGEDLEGRSPYLRVLGFNDRGRKVLRRLKKTSDLPLISGTPPKVPGAREYFELESRATDLYRFFAPEWVREPLEREKTERPVYVKN